MDGVPPRLFMRNPTTFSLTRQLARLAQGHESAAQRQGQGGTEDETARLKACARTGFQEGEPAGCESFGGCRVDRQGGGSTSTHEQPWSPCCGSPFQTAGQSQLL